MKKQINGIKINKNKFGNEGNKKVGGKKLIKYK